MYHPKLLKAENITRWVSPPQYEAATARADLEYSRAKQTALQLRAAWPKSH